MRQKEKIKIVQIIADSKLGGGPAHVLGILGNIDKEKFDCFLICPPGYLSKMAKEIEGVRVININMRSKFDLKAFFEIKETLHMIQAMDNPFGPMIAHFHGARAGFLGRFVMPKQIINVYTEHSLDYNYHLNNPVNEWIQKIILARLNQKTNLIIAVSSSVADYLIKNNLAPKDRTFVIPNGISLTPHQDQESKRHKIKAGHKAPIIGSIGSLNRQKGYNYLIEAMPYVLKHYPLATMEIIGDGPENGKLQELIRENKLEHHVSLLGKKENISEYLQHWDVFALSSISETFGLVILESMKVGVPVVATKTGGIVDVVQDGKSGLLVPPKNSKELAKAIVKIIDRPVLAAKLKQGGLRRVDDFNWKSVIKKIENVYFHLITAQKRS